MHQMTMRSDYVNGENEMPPPMYQDLDNDNHNQIVSRFGY